MNTDSNASAAVDPCEIAYKNVRDAVRKSSQNAIIVDRDSFEDGWIQCELHYADRIASLEAEVAAGKAELNRLIEWASDGAANWRTQQDNTPRTTIVDVCGTQGPHVISLNARAQSFEAFVEKLEQAFAAINGTEAK